jgi:hypothetical protein
MSVGIRAALCFALVFLLLLAADARAQEKIRVGLSSIETFIGEKVREVEASAFIKKRYETEYRFN